MENVADRDATDWLRRGALHWASLALLEDAAQNSTDHLGESWAWDLPTLPVEGGTIKVSIEDAQSRFNLNSIRRHRPASLAEPPGPAAPARRAAPRSAARQCGSPTGSTTNSEARAGGAEDIDYLNLNPPYRAANRPMASVDELRLIRGFDAKTVAALVPYVTVLPATSNNVNVNTASPEMLAALVQGLDLPTAQPHRPRSGSASRSTTSTLSSRNCRKARLRRWREWT